MVIDKQGGKKAREAPEVGGASGKQGQASRNGDTTKGIRKGKNAGRRGKTPGN